MYRPDWWPQDSQGSMQGIAEIAVNVHSTTTGAMEQSKEELRFDIRCLAWWLENWKHSDSQFDELMLELVREAFAEAHPELTRRIPCVIQDRRMLSEKLGKANEEIERLLSQSVDATIKHNESLEAENKRLLERLEELECDIDGLLDAFIVAGVPMPSFGKQFDHHISLRNQLAAANERVAEAERLLRRLVGGDECWGESHWCDEHDCKRPCDYEVARKLLGVTNGT